MTWLTDQIRTVLGLLSRIIDLVQEVHDKVDHLLDDEEARLGLRSPRGPRPDLHHRITIVNDGYIPLEDNDTEGQNRPPQVDVDNDDDSSLDRSDDDDVICLDQSPSVSSTLQPPTLSSPARAATPGRQVTFSEVSGCLLLHVYTLNVAYVASYFQASPTC